MKKLLLCLAFLSTIGQMGSQTTLNRAYHDVIEASNPFLVNINGNLYFTTENYDPQHFGQTNLYKHTAREILFSSYPFPVVIQARDLDLLMID